MRRLRRCLQRSGCAWAVHLRRGRMPLLCAIRYLAKNGFTGPILASITALTRLSYLCAALPPVRSPGRHSLVLNGHVAAQVPHREPLLRQHAADDIRADRAHEPVRLTVALPRGSDECLGKLAQEPLRCRQLFGNRFEGRLPTSLLAMRITGLLYAPLPVSALELATPRASCRRCSLFPQEGCPLARHGREGQDKAANDFGVCVAGPVRPLVAEPIGPSLQHAHRAPAHKPTLAHRCETDREIRITDERPNAVAPAMSAAASGRNGPIFRPACRIMNWPLSISLSALCLVLSPQNREQQPCVYCVHCCILGQWLVLLDPIGIFSTARARARARALQRTLEG